VSGLTDELALMQLASIRYQINPRGLIEIESKEDMRKRGVKSPDRAEAIMLAFANLTPPISLYYQHRVERAVEAQQACRQCQHGPALHDQGVAKCSVLNCLCVRYLKPWESALEVQRQYQPNPYQEDVDKLMEIYNSVGEKIRKGEPW